MVKKIAVLFDLGLHARWTQLPEIQVEKRALNSGSYLLFQYESSSSVPRRTVKLTNGLSRIDWIGSFHGTFGQKHVLWSTSHS